MSEPAHLAIIGGLPLRVFHLSEGEYIAGRLPEAQVRLDHLEVSRRHCRFHQVEEGWVAEDLGSQWGTRFNGEPMSGPVLLRAGDQIQIGPVVLLFGMGEAPEDSVFEKLRINASSETAPVMVAGREVTRIPLGEQLSLGRDPESAVVLNDPAVSRRHAMVRREGGRFLVVDLKSTTGSLVNGRRFDDHPLTIGDRLQIGPYLFQFDGHALNRLTGGAGGTVDGVGLVQRAGKVQILDSVSLHVGGSRFAGIIGLSGAGKSTLLDVLSGMREPASGKVLLDGTDIYAGAATPAFGYVPQQDIVHGELTVREALTFGALLRLPRGTSASESGKLVEQTIAQLGLSGRERTRVGQLSGGQRKRVSVGVELLARPAVLFLDEPSSGLDPATEFKLMELLRDLADGGCTIVCTTHVVENIYLLDQLLIVHRGRLLFSGSPQEARERFGVQRISELYDVLEATPAGEAQPAVEPPMQSSAESRGRKVKRARSLPVLLARQWAILRAEWSNFAILAGQPVLVGALVSWVTNDAALALFFAYLATLWFGCSNASQEIVRELPIFRRERVIGLKRTSYLFAKLLFLGGTTAVQGLLLYATLLAGERGLDGAVAWQVAALLGISGASVAIGLAISALARSLLQAVMIVPLLLIPLILFSGYTVPANEMNPPVLAVSRFMPTFAAQRVMDVSFLWKKEIARSTLSDHWTSLRNIQKVVDVKTGDTFANSDPGLGALGVLAGWIVAASGVAWLGLRGRERA